MGDDPIKIVSAHLFKNARSMDFPSRWAAATATMTFIHCSSGKEALALVSPDLVGVGHILSNGVCLPEVCEDVLVSSSDSMSTIATCWLDENSTVPDPEVLLGCDPGSVAKYGFGDHGVETLDSSSVFPVARLWMPHTIKGRFLAAYVPSHLRSWIVTEFASRFGR